MYVYKYVPSVDTRDRKGFGMAAGGIPKRKVPYDGEACTVRRTRVYIPTKCQELITVIVGYQSKTCMWAMGLSFPRGYWKHACLPLTR